MATKPVLRRARDWASASDSELIDASILIADLGEVEGLVRDKPDPSLMPHLVGEYHFDTSNLAAKQWCCHCQSNTHWHGFVAEDDTGHRYSLGSQCGPAHYGMSFNIAENELKAVRGRQTALQRLRVVAKLAPDVVADANRLLVSIDLKRLEHKRAALEKNLHFAVVALRRLLAAGDQLYVFTTSRDERGREKEFRTPIGSIRGAALIRPLTVRMAITAMKGIVEQLTAIWTAGAHERDGDRVRGLLKQLTDATEKVLQMLADVREAHRFFEPDHLELLARWSAATMRDRRIATDGRGLFSFSPGHQGDVVFELAPVKLADPASLVALRDAL